MRKRPHCERREAILILVDVRWNIPGAAVLAAAAASASFACPTEPRSAAGARLVEQRWVAALEKRDKRELGCILDESFADTNWRGELVSRSQVMKALASRPASTLELSDVRPVVIGNVALVRGINRQRNGTRIVGSVRFVDVFVYRSGRWRAISAQETLMR